MSQRQQQQQLPTRKDPRMTSSHVSANQMLHEGLIQGVALCAKHIRSEATHVSSGSLHAKMR